MQEPIGHNRLSSHAPRASHSYLNRYIYYSFAGFVAGAAFIFLVLQFIPIERGKNEIAPPDHQELVHTCLDRVLNSLSTKSISPGLYERMWRVCENQIFNGLFLDDLRIRRQKFTLQQLDERVNLWLVVTITISGVLLAAAQLFLSYRLALSGHMEFGKDSELAIQTGKISLKSSITWAVILALSFAFFMVYVVYIYSEREVPWERPRNLLTVPQDEAPLENSPTVGAPPAPKETVDGNKR